jgi:virginiamycin B lyase
MRKDLISVAVACIVLAGCGSHQAVPGPTTAGTLSKHGGVGGPDVVQTGKIPVKWTQFAWGGTNLPHQFDGVVAGTDKNMWYTDYNDHALIKMTMAGSPHLFSLVFGGTTNFFPGSIAVGADGKFYMSGVSPVGVIGVATTTGSFSVKNLPSGDQGYAGGLALGPDGNIWFTELKHIGKITTSGTVTEFAYADGNTTNYYGSMVAGPDGDMWATEYNANIVDDIDPATGNMTAYSLPCQPNGIVAAADGNLWISCSSQIVRVTTSGSYTAFSNPYSSDTYPTGFVKGPDGNPWFDVSGRNMIGEFNTQSNSISIYFPPSTQGNVYGLAAGPDGNVWGIDTAGKTDVFIINPLGVNPSSVTFHVNNTQTLTVTEKGTSAWTATSSNPGVASVANGGQANQFVLTGHGLGSTNVTIKDAIGNSFVVKVKVT